MLKYLESWNHVLEFFCFFSNSSNNILWRSNFMITKKSHGILTHKLILVYLILSLLLCHLFSYYNEVKLDLRTVPFIIGSWYFRHGPILVFVIILLRIHYGVDFGFYLGTIVYSYKRNNTGLDIIENRNLVSF